jgi:HD-like signal output (HDOD) protein
LPSPSDDYAAVIDDLSEPERSVEQASLRVAADPPMAAKVLQLANSAAYGPPLDEADPSAAVTSLGLANTRRMLLLAHTYSSFREINTREFSMPGLWQHARRTSVLAGEIALREGCRPLRVRQAATAGLLHDLGKIALAANLPGKFRSVQRLIESTSLSSCEAEEEIFGAHHGEVGGSLLGLWGLPPAVVEAVALHHHPSRFLSDRFSPLTAVHIANALAHAATMEDAWVYLDRDYLGELHLEDHLSAWWQARATVEAAGVAGSKTGSES